MPLVLRQIFPLSLKEVHTLNDLKALLPHENDSGKPVGFVPTMGALHQGHLALVREALKDGVFVVVSIFVNPLQFNNPNDLRHYPSSPKQDRALLEEAGVPLLYTPSFAEVFGQEQPMTFDLAGLDTYLEGASRPNHFQGVANVLYRFFGQVKPRVAYFGLKDYQQVMVVKQLVKQHFPQLTIKAIPTLRDSEGLALSSRNTRLSAQAYKRTLFVPRFLKALTQKWADWNWEEAKRELEQGMKAHRLSMEYAALLDAESLKTLSEFDPKRPMLLSLAWFADDVRLIDNVPVNQPFTTFEAC